MDKFLDTYFMAFTAYTIFAWKNKAMKHIALSLFVWRMIGFVAFELTHIRYLLVIFPNVFLTFFLYYQGSIKLFKRDLFKSRRNILIFFLLTLLIKMPREFILHYFELQPWNWFKANILGTI